MPIIEGSTPATAEARTRASGRRPFSSRSETTTSADAPSLMPLALPAVTVPLATNAGFSAASFSSVVSGRGCSSRSTSCLLPAAAVSTATSSSSNAPSAAAQAARRWLSTANRSCSSLVIP